MKMMSETHRVQCDTDLMTQEAIDGYSSPIMMGAVLGHIEIGYVELMPNIVQKYQGKQYAEYEQKMVRDVKDSIIEHQMSAYSVFEKEKQLHQISYGIVGFIDEKAEDGIAVDAADTQSEDAKQNDMFSNDAITEKNTMWLDIASADGKRTNMHGLGGSARRSRRSVLGKSYV